VPDNMPNKEIEIVKVRMIPVPNYNIMGGCDPWFRIENKEYEYNSMVLMIFNIIFRNK